MKRILIVEDDISIAEIQRDFLEIEGYNITIVTDGLEGYKTAKAEKFDLILLDLMLPNMNGIDICRGIRGEVDVPIIMVTAKGDETDKIRGLGLGADDYIAKPFSPTELVARVKANLAQYERLKSKMGDGVGGDKRANQLNAGSVSINLSTHRVHVHGEEVDLKNKEYELLVFMAQNPDMVFSKEHLYERIWGMDSFGDLKTVAVHISRLREKIEKDPQNPAHIETVWGAGYRFKI
ncbi:MAG: response regulator transcription factor [Defluviitaleaceae bacterium]|nr:response regulator transcription factor [Defluviitaleaceae bacterium]